MLKENPVFKRMFEMARSRSASSRRASLQREVCQRDADHHRQQLKAKGLLDKNIRVALSAMNLRRSPTSRTAQKLDELEETSSARESVARSPTQVAARRKGGRPMAASPRQREGRDVQDDLAVNLGAWLAREKNKKTLIVDLDTQATAQEPGWSTCAAPRAPSSSCWWTRPSSWRR